MTASYDAGSVMVRVRRAGDAFKAESVFDMKNNEWNSEVHTPIVYQGPPVRRRQKEARPVHLPGFRRQGSVDQRRQSFLRPGQFPAGGWHVLRDGRQYAANCI